MIVKADYHGELRKFRTPSTHFPSYSELISQIRRVFPLAQDVHLRDVYITRHGSTIPLLLEHRIDNQAAYDGATAWLHSEPSYQSALLRLSVVDNDSQQQHQGQSQRPFGWNIFDDIASGPAAGWFPPPPPPPPMPPAPFNFDSFDVPPIPGFFPPPPPMFRLPTPPPPPPMPPIPPSYMNPFFSNEDHANEHDREREHEHQQDRERRARRSGHRQRDGRVPPASRSRHSPIQRVPGGFPSPITAPHRHHVHHRQHEHHHHHSQNVPGASRMRRNRAARSKSPRPGPSNTGYHVPSPGDSPVPRFLEFTDDENETLFGMRPPAREEYGMGHHESAPSHVHFHDEPQLEQRYPPHEEPVIFHDRAPTSEALFPIQLPSVPQTNPAAPVAAQFDTDFGERPSAVPVHTRRSFSCYSAAAWISAENGTQSPQVDLPAPQHPEQDACCPLDASKREVKGIVNNFLRDFTRVMSDTFGDEMEMHRDVGPSSAARTSPRPSPPDEQPLHPGVWCDACGESVRGTRYKCNECFNYDLCSRCHGRSNVHSPAHAFQKIDTPVVFRPDIAPTPAFGMDYIIGRDVPLDQVDPNAAPAVHRSVVCDKCDEDIIGERNKCVDCADYDLCSACIGSMRTFHNPAHRFFTLSRPNRIVIHTVDDLFNPPAAAPATARAPTPVVPPSTAHIEELLPALRSVVLSGHEVVSRAATHIGEQLGSRPPLMSTTAPANSPPQYREAHELVDELRYIVQDAHTLIGRAETQHEHRAEHPATCDLCDSHVVGVRWKCLDCPDWDACEACYAIVREQHPGHRFVKIESKDQLPSVANSMPARHYASCDACQNKIYGVRYKCMHASCPDFDLCANCEALPIKVHPEAHPLLKIVDPNTVIPTVVRNVRRVLRPASPSMRPATPISPPMRPVTPIIARDYAPSARAPTFSQGSFIAPAPLGCQLPRLPTPQSFTPFIPIPTPPPVIHPLTPPVAQPVNVRNDVMWYCPPALVSPPLPPIPSPPMAPVTPPMPAVSIPVLAPTVMLSPPPPALPEKPFMRFSQVWNPGFSQEQKSTPVDFERRPFADPFGDPEPIITPAEARASLLDASVDEILKGSDVPDFDYREHVHEEDAFRHEYKRSSVDDEAERVYREALAEVEKEMERKRAEERRESERKRAEERQDKGKRRMTQEEVRKLFAYDDGEETEPDEDRSETMRKTKEEVRRLFERVPLPERSSPKVSEHEDREALSSKPSTPVSFFSLGQEPRELEVHQETREMKPEWSLPPIESVASSMSFSDLVRERTTARAFPSVPVEEPVVVEESVVLPVEARTMEPEPIHEAEDVVIAAPPVVLTRKSRVSRQSSLFNIAPLVRSPTEGASELVATFISNNNVEDGHVFPPGAEFVKSWLMANEGSSSWPEATELVYVAGYRMANDENAPMRYAVGAVPSGGRADVVAADMKAPDVPGRYIGFWRLSDGLGNFFGHRVWCDIIVAEPEHDSDQSLAASSIVMPASAPANAPSVVNDDASQPPETPRTETGSEPESDAESDVSLIDLSEDSDDEWEEGRRLLPTTSAAAPAVTPKANTHHEGDDYVVLYDSASSADEA
ncbi:hypothetical protein EXIGLDRAFT_145493 [Exidia glandulosa HHB12029]|uniref:ZZ-type domain-containing protein n=1 Tax=Exidia glandulosa HHB12029 TaxID=1314781 RepID=A0A165NDF6_EXIGL|nr:hypothetical protein EXIGLDRAFT_145493 [Exidia glandulosa HHB12029]